MVTEIPKAENSALKQLYTEVQQKENNPVRKFTVQKEKKRSMSEQKIDSATASILSSYTIQLKTTFSGDPFHFHSSTTGTKQVSANPELIRIHMESASVVYIG